MKSIFLLLGMLSCGVVVADDGLADNYMHYLETSSEYDLCYEREMMYLGDNSELYEVANAMRILKGIADTSSECLRGSIDARKDFEDLGKMPYEPDEEEYVMLN
ncbi:MAG: hypothetical protein ACRCUJ_06410 [Phocaeicola sp.]